MKLASLAAIVVTTVLAFPVLSHSQTTWIVDQGGVGDFLTIQEGIGAASGGDTVLVKDGTYTGAGNKFLDYGGKAITVESENGPELTIIDCEGDGQAFYFHSGETETSILRGITIRNGHFTNGGGIQCIQGSGPLIENCVIEGCTAENEGNAIYVKESSPRLKGLVISSTGAAVSFVQVPSLKISGCTIDVVQGTGIRSSSPDVDSVLTVDSCTIRGDPSSTGGSGIYFRRATLTVIGSTIMGHPTAGIFCESMRSLTVEDSTISENGDAQTEPRYGYGGISISSSDNVIIRNSLITENKTGEGRGASPSYGGGLSVGFADRLEVQNSSITHNILEGHYGGAGGHALGGGLFFRGNSCLIGSSTISQNVASTASDGDPADYARGAGAHIDAQDSCLIENSTISQNVASGTPDSYGGGINFEESGALVNCLVTNNSARFGGGVYFFTSEESKDIINSTISDNTATEQGGGVVCVGSPSGPATASITNSILWNNAAPEGPQIWIGSTTDPSTVFLGYSDVEGGAEGVHVEPTCFLNDIGGNFSSAPLFVSGPLGDYYLSQIQAGQGADSPCVDAGDVSTEPWGWNFRTTRTDEIPDDGIVDLGFHYSFPFSCTDEDDDGFAIEGDVCGAIDCDDTDASTYPNAVELCDYKDNQCSGDEGYGQVDEGCALALVSPDNGTEHEPSPAFTWQAGLSDAFYLFLVLPLPGYGYYELQVPTSELSFQLPTWFWNSALIAPDTWAAWVVLGIDTTPEPDAWEVSEVRWFKKVQ